MACEDSRIAEMLNDLVSGHLTPEQAELVKEHLRFCQDCLEQLRTMSILTGKSPAKFFISPSHLPDELLEQYYQNKSALSTEKIHFVEDHLKICSDCSANLDFLVALEADLKSSVSEERAGANVLEQFLEKLRSFLWRPAIAYLLLLVCLYPALQWLVLPSNESTTPSSQAQLPAFDLKDQTRAGGGVTLIKHHRDEVLLALNIPYHHLYGERWYGFLVTDPDATRSFDVKPACDFSQKGVVRLLIDSSPLTDGNYVLTVLEVDRTTPRDTTRQTFQFEIKTR